MGEDPETGDRRYMGEDPETGDRRYMDEDQETKGGFSGFSLISHSLH